MLVLKGFKEFNFGLSHSFIIRKENMKRKQKKIGLRDQEGIQNLTKFYWKFTICFVL